MRALRSFTVQPRLPGRLSSLHALAMNLRWSWDDRTQDLFRWVEPDAWEATGHDPIRLLGMVDHRRLDALAADRAFLSFMAEVHGDLRRDLEADRWFQGRQGKNGEPSPLGSVAYFSPEFGIAEALPQYSGGLGVLAGDHLKAASSLGVPLFGVGLFYHQGYFRQELNPDGWQKERYVDLDPHVMALTPIEGLRVQVDLAGTPLLARIWKAQVGRVPLYMLDTDVEDNDDDSCRTVTDRLYGGDSEHRLRQEILLGIGGVRALELLGHDVQVFHSNEGHAGFLGLERVRRAIVDDGLSFDEAIEAVRAGTVFTTHTPVPAGMDRFPRGLMEHYFKGWAHECDVDFDRVMALGHQPGEPSDAPFNMAVMGLRLAASSNGVSKLHGVVSRQIFAPVWPGVPVEELPIRSVTNGVHSRTWVSPEMRDLFDRHVLPEWHEAGPDRWARIDDAGDDELWRARAQARERLIAYVRRRLRESALARGLSEPEAAWCDEAFDPGALTIGFARRFAPYKRATLLLSQADRLKALLLDADRPMQLLFAGKAHPADDLGKDLIREVVQFSRQTDVRHRVAFLEDYDMALARVLLQGCDVWLNTPRRPLEACGTSGEKAALNGALNCSIRDGWWDEYFDGENGWAIASTEGWDDLGRRDQAEAASLFDILERQIVPLFYERAPGRPPQRWLQRVRRSLRTLGPEVSASRMVRDYVADLYEPAAAAADVMAGDRHQRARDLAGWKQRVVAGWPGVAVGDIVSDSLTADLGSNRRVSAAVALGTLSPSDVDVQLVHGPVGPTDELTDTAIVTMALVPPTLSDAGAVAETGHRYEGSFTCERAGRYGFTVRVVPSHPHLSTFAEMGRVAWAVHTPTGP
ncbi:MAG: alpha-glucan family phosphorylase [Actinomycetota bacterium]|nr:alpha-glucan family phosphorylase [Actinomycetota bacterium]